MTKLRFAAWWILKSPWRKKYGLIKTMRLALRSVLVKTKHNSNIVLCVSCCDRIQQLSEVFLPSIKRMLNHEQLEIVLVCSESERLEIEQIVKEAGISNLRIIPNKNKFSRSTYLNIALDQAGTENIFITDIDIELPSNLIELFHSYVYNNTAWFPVCDLLDMQGNIEGQYPEGVGLVGFVKSKDLRLDSSIDTWGNEDWQFLYLLFENNIYPKRSQNEGFLHHFHPPVDKKNYKKKW